MDARVTIQHHMSEEYTDSMEALLPALAQMALQRAHRRALATNGVLVQARRSQLLETFADGTLRVIQKRSIGRRADAVNTALRVAKGELVCMIDADSMLAPDSLLRLVVPLASRAARRGSSG